MNSECVDLWKEMFLFYSIEMGDIMSSIKTFNELDMIKLSIKILGFFLHHVWNVSLGSGLSPSVEDYVAEWLTIKFDLHIDGNCRWHSYLVYLKKVLFMSWIFQT
jgi:hypothetical protein